MIWPDQPFLSLLVVLILTMGFFYLAREPIHRALSALKDGVVGGLNNIADWTQKVAEQLSERNRKVLVESGLRQAEEKISHEFVRLESSYTKRLSAYPELHLRLGENVAKIDTDYKECSNVPPEVPGWTEVVESLTKVSDKASDRILRKMLGEVQKSAVAGEKKALQEYRTQIAKRHKILGGMAPTWQKLEKRMKQVDNVVSSTLDTTKKINKYMADYQELRGAGDESADLLSSKATKLFVFALIVIIVAIGSAFINFQLIALPMSELVPAGARIVGVRIADLAALVIVTLELVVGIFLMESVGITGIFPQIAGMSRGKRRTLMYAALGGLFFLASVEATLAILREHLVAAEIALKQALAGAAAVVDAQRSLIPAIGQATLGFVLPWILAMVAVPLEILIESGQHVLGKLLAVLVVGFGYLCRALAYLLDTILKILIHLYDAYIVLPALLAKTAARKAE